MEAAQAFVLGHYGSYMAGAGLYGLLPFVLIVGGIALAIKQAWVVAAILIVMGVFGLWLLSRYGDSGPMRPE